MFLRTYIKCGKWNNKLLIPIVFPTFAFIRRYLREIFLYEKRIKPFYEIFFNYLSMSICGIIYLFVYFKSKSELINDKHTDNLTNNSILNMNVLKIKMIEEKKSKKRRTKKIFLFLASFILLSLGYVFQIIKNDNIEFQFRQNIAVLIIIFYLCIFSKLILKFTMKIHQIISIIIIGLCLSVCFIQALIHLYKQGKLTTDVIKSSIIYFGVMQFFFILGDVLSKRYLDNYEGSPYLFIFKIGIIGLIITIIIGIILSINNHESDLLELIKFCFSDKFFLILIDILCGTCFLIGLYLTLYYFTPFQFIISETITEFCETLLKLIEVKFNDDPSDDKYYSNEQIITFPFLYIFIFLGVIVFNEIIILSCFNLNENTREEIDRRQSLESIIDVEENEINEEYDDGGIILNKNVNMNTVN